MYQFERIAALVLVLLQDPGLNLRALVGEGDLVETVLHHDILLCAGLLGAGSRSRRRHCGGSLSSGGLLRCGRLLRLGLLLLLRLLRRVLEDQLLADEYDDECKDEYEN